MGDDEGPAQDAGFDHGEVLPEGRVNDPCRRCRAFLDFALERCANLPQIFIQRPPLAVAGCEMDLKTHEL